MQHKLAAILSADAAGFSRLMGEDEVATVRVLATCRGLAAEVIARHGGRVVDMPGDNMLAEFGSAVSAVEAASDMQTQLKGCNSALPEPRRLAFRIGVNLGDVMVEDGRLYGDGVNVAARIEALADPGGICISGKVYDEVRRKLDLSFDDLGEHPLKNIAAPVRVYRVRVNGHAPAQPAAAASAAGAAKPSIIVLPFSNMSGDAEQEFFADGLTEDLLTGLSRFHELFVISRNTSFKWKGRAVDVRKVAQELNVHYVVEGSVRKAGKRVRVTVQLIDAEQDRHLWAERYDRDLEDIFALQDEVTNAIVAVLPGRVEAATRERAARKPPANMAAYECLATAKVLHHRSTRDDNRRALELVERAIALDPKYAHAHAWRACIVGQAATCGWRDMQEALVFVEGELDVAAALDDNDSDVHRIYSALRLRQHDFERAAYHQQRALELNPNDDLIVVQRGELLTWTGEPEEGVEWIRKAMRLNPYHPARFWGHLARALFGARRYLEAAEAAGHIPEPDLAIRAFMAGCLAAGGDPARAAVLAREVIARKPDFSLQRDYIPMLHYQREADLAHHRDALLRAGLPQ